MISIFEEAVDKLRNYYLERGWIINENFLNYPCPEVLNINKADKTYLKYSFLFRELNEFLGEWTIFDDSLSTIIGKKFKIETSLLPKGYGEISKGISEENITNFQIIEMCPKILILDQLSIAAKKLFIRLIQKVNVKNNLVQYFGNMNFNNLINEDLYQKGLDELFKTSFLTKEIALTEFLNELTKENLFEIIKKYNLPLITKSKYESIPYIINNLEPYNTLHELNDYLGPLENYIKIDANPINTIKKFIWGETFLLVTYFKHIKNKVNYLEALKSEKIKHNNYSRSNSNNKSQGLSYLEEEDDDDDDDLPNVTTEELNIIRKYWTLELDKEIITLYNKYGWDMGWAIHYHDIFRKHLSEEKLEEYKRECMKAALHVWYNIPTYFAQYRIRELKMPIIKEAKQKCKYCGEEFINTSISFGYVRTLIKSVDDIRFCATCYGKAFYLSNKSMNKYKREELIDKLSKLYHRTSILPSWCNILSVNC